MTNHLAQETSPYLLQHAHNPVDWYPWGEEALEKARVENKPIFLSIGYAACHWCHVMERESFESDHIAQLLNRHFVSIKVDREERPDLDNIYMNAVVAMTGQGGWPMSIFLTPELKPFYGGTYFPPVPRHGMPSFQDVLSSFITAWDTQQNDIQRISGQITQHLQSSASWEINNSGNAFSREILETVSQNLIDTYDWSFGGWGSAPRFPAPLTIDFLLRQLSRENNPGTEKLVRHILTTMSLGGLFDVVGGGFHRYSTDDHWLVPHFEKMLYDNAQLALVYLHAYLITHDESFRAVCEETLSFIQREMLGPEGGFFSSLDADSEGEEGKFYTWTPDEILLALQDPDELKFIQLVYSLPKAGNFDGKIILQKKEPDTVLAERTGLPPSEFRVRLRRIHKKLLEVREKRVRPSTDDKILVSWNALALRVFSEAARYLDNPEYLKIAQNNASFLLNHLFQEKQLFRSWRAGRPHHPAFLEDYAGLLIALVTLYQTDHNTHWFLASKELLNTILSNFSDPEGGFFDTPQGKSGLLIRPKEIQDNVTPSGNALAAHALILQSAYDYNPELRQRAEKMLGSIMHMASRYPRGFSYWLQVADFAVEPIRQIVIIHPSSRDSSLSAFKKLAWSEYHPDAVLAIAPYPTPPDVPILLQDRPLKNDLTTAYICEGFVCLNPVNTLEEFKNQLGSLYPN